MHVVFTLTMSDVIVCGQVIDELILQWSDSIDQKEVVELSHRWISEQNFLTSRMSELSYVGESTLTIEPLEDSSTITHSIG